MFKKLLILIITAFVDMVGLLMVIPLMPFYARKLGAGSLVVTVLVVSFTAAQLLSAPLWGRFSADRSGVLGRSLSRLLSGRPHDC